MKFRDYYEVLGVERSADADTLKKAYRRLARKYHPDVSKEANAEEKFKEVQEAYDVLKDSEKRSSYDQLGKNWKHGQDFQPPPGYGGGQGGFNFSTGGAGGFSDFFDSMFSGAGGARGGQGSPFGGGGGNPFGDGGFAGFGGQQGARRERPPQELELKITLEEAFNGGSRQLRLKGGDGEKTLNIKIPVGAVDGQKLRLKGQAGGADLILILKYQPHPWFTADGKDIHFELALAPWEAALGASLPVRTLGGEVRMNIKPGAESGKKLRLKGRGMPAGKSANAGDQFVTLKIIVPEADTDELTAAYEQLRDAAGEFSAR